MARYREENPECKIYVGDLSTRATKEEVEDAFAYYGPIRSVWVARNPPGFAFVEFEDIRDAEDAVREVDGRRTICGRRVRVERAGNKRGRGGGFRGSYRGSGGRRGRPFNPDDRCYECGKSGHYARDCRRRTGRSSRGRGGDRSYSRSTSRDRSRSRGRRSRDRSRSRSSRSRSVSRPRNAKYASKSRSRSRDNGRDRDSSRDRSKSRNRSKSSRSRSNTPYKKNEVNGDQK